VLALAAVPTLVRALSVRALVIIEIGLVAAVAALGATGILFPDAVPEVPKSGGPLAVAVVVVGAAFFSLLVVRAVRTYVLTRRRADLLVVVGIVWLATALFPQLLMTPYGWGWWLGHALELFGVAFVAGPVALDLHRGAQSRPLAGDLRAAELVAAEEAFLGAHVRSLLVHLATKDAYTEVHTRRVALLAVRVAELLGLSAGRLRSLAIGGLLHDIGKLSVPVAILQKPAPLTDAEFEVIQHHPERGARLVDELGGFPPEVRRLVLDHHERLDGQGYPRGLRAEQIDLETRILTVCDVYDALVSKRVYREAWSQYQALALLAQESGAAFDPRCVSALEEVLADEELSPIGMRLQDAPGVPPALIAPGAAR
jgi:putative nucleotidyltransferase with HDIG domain